MSLNCFIEIERKVPSDLCGEIFRPSFPRKMSAGLYGKYSKYLHTISMNLFSFQPDTSSAVIQNKRAVNVLHRAGFATNQPLIQSFTR